MTLLFLSVPGAQLASGEGDRCGCHQDRESEEVPCEAAVAALRTGHQGDEQVIVGQTWLQRVC